MSSKLLRWLIFICAVGLIGHWMALSIYYDHVEYNSSGSMDSSEASRLIRFLGENDLLLQTILMKMSVPEGDVEYFCIMSTDRNLTYAFNIPFSVLSWKALGVRPIIVFVGAEQYFLTTPPLALVLHVVRRLGAMVFFLNTDLIDSATVAQTIRVYASGLKNLNISDGSILITVDSDLLTLRLENHIPQNGSQMFIYNLACCGVQQRPGEPHDYLQHPLNTIAMTVAKWRNLTGIARNAIGGGDDLASLLVHEFPNTTLENVVKGEENWYIDQILLSSMINRWVNDSEQRLDLIGYYLTTSVSRIDRSKWMEYEFETMNITGYDDVHLPLPLFTEPSWQHSVKLFRRIYDNDTLTFLENYRECFVGFVNRTDSTYIGALP